MQRSEERMWYPERKAQGRAMEGKDDAGRLCGESSRILRLRQLCACGLGNSLKSSAAAGLGLT